MAHPTVAPLRRLRLAARCGGALLVCWVIATPAARATTTISSAAGAVTILGDGAPSRLVNRGNGSGIFTELLPGAALIAGPGCVPAGRGAVNCGAISDATGVVATLGGGDDAYTSSGTAPQVIDGGDGNDTIATGSGFDTITGGAGSDHLSGGAGNDIIWARDGEADTVDCGGGADFAQVDGSDLFTACSTLDRPLPAPPAGGPPTAGSPPAPAPGTSTTSPLEITGSLVLRRTPGQLARGKKLRFAVTTTATCTARVVLAVSRTEARRLRLGRTSLTLGTSAPTQVVAIGAAATTVTLGVHPEFRAGLARARKVQATAVVDCVDAAARSSTSGMKATLGRSR